MRAKWLILQGIIFRDLQLRKRLRYEKQKV
jgi:hypothetical protein